MFEVICRDRWDHRYLDYPPLPPRLQQLRGRARWDVGAGACGHHIALVTGCVRSEGRLGCRVVRDDPAWWMRKTARRFPAGQEKRAGR